MATDRVDPLDLLAVDHLLRDDERDIQATVRRFVAERIRPSRRRAGTRPARSRSSSPRSSARSACSACTSRGTAAPARTRRRTAWPASSSRPATRAPAASCRCRARWRCSRSGAGGARSRSEAWLPRMAAGEVIGCFGLTEPDFGSNPAGMRTRARRDGDDWVLDGTKMWITNGSVADVAVVWAQTDDGIRGFLVPTGTPGFSATTMHGKLSLRASITSELVLDGVRLPASARAARGARAARPAVLPRRGEVRDRVRRGRRGARLPRDRDRVRRRPRGVRPPAGGVPAHPGQARRHGAGAAEGVPARACTSAGSRTSTGSTAGRSASASSTTSGRRCKIARECRTILGANGITLEYGVLRHANNLESVLTYEGTSEVHSLVIGQALTGHGAFS